MTAEWTYPLAYESFWLAPWVAWLVSGLLFLTVVVWIRLIFGQQGEVKLSPQREAAIATGHADRTTLFENSVFRPLLWLLVNVAHSLRLPRLKNWVRKQLVAAGSPNFYTAEEYIALGLLGGVGVTLVLEIFHFLVVGSLSLTTVLLGLFIGLALTLYQLAINASKRMMSITKQLPYAMDLLALAMGAGATFTEAVSTIVRDSRGVDEEDNALNVEFQAMMAEIELGTTRREALANLSRRVPLESVKNLVSSITQAEQLGTPLTNVLRDQARLLRERRSLRAEEKAAAAGVRILIPCLLLVMACMLMVLGPFIIRAMEGGLF
jgi:tight adherence protein C